MKFQVLLKQAGKKTFFVLQEIYFMTMTDPIADYLTRIRNAVRAGHKKVDIPDSNIKNSITQILHDHRFIKNYIQFR